MKTVLVIEDTFEVNENICEILSLDGFETLSAVDGKQGVSLAIKERPDIILCDIMMPELDGFGVLKILAKNEVTNSIPFIFLTAKSEMNDLRKGMGLGADDYLTKPFSDSDLLEAIEVRLKKREVVTAVKNEVKQFFSAAKTDDVLNKLSINRELRYFRKKEVIYNKGNSAHWLFFVVSGSVKCYRANEYGKELIIHIYKHGDYFGFPPLIKDSYYIDNAVALEKSTLGLIPKTDFRLLLFNNKDYAAQFIKMIADRAESVETQLMELAYSSVRRKVVTTLLYCADSSNSTMIGLSREDLAARAGVAKDTLNRTLSDFKTEGIIEVTKNYISILNLEKLKMIPQG